MALNLSMLNREWGMRSEKSVRRHPDLPAVRLNLMLSTFSPDCSLAVSFFTDTLSESLVSVRNIMYVPISDMRIWLVSNVPRRAGLSHWS